MNAFFHFFSSYNGDRLGLLIRDAVQEVWPMPGGLNFNSVDVFGSSYEPDELFHDSLLGIEEFCSNSGCQPAIHIDFHGCREGLLLGDEKFFSWGRFLWHMQRISKASNGQVFLGFSSCMSEDFVRFCFSYFMVLDFQPFRFILCPIGSPSTGDVKDDLILFYEEFLKPVDNVLDPYAAWVKSLSDKRVRLHQDGYFFEGFEDVLLRGLEFNLDEFSVSVDFVDSAKLLLGMLDSRIVERCVCVESMSEYFVNEFGVRELPEFLLCRVVERELGCFFGLDDSRVSQLLSEAFCFDFYMFKVGCTFVGLVGAVSERFSECIRRMARVFESYVSDRVECLKADLTHV